MSEVAPRPAVLFPLDPRPGETVFGYALRVCEWNFLGNLQSTFGALGVPGGWLPEGRVASSGELEALATAFGIPAQKMREAWGAEPPVSGRTRLGGVWLRSHMISRARRRLPSSIAPGQSDQAFWRVRHLGFCNKNWEYLRDTCPREWCGKPLTWVGASSLTRCAFCGACVSEAKPRKIEVKDRPILGWLSDFFSEEDATVKASMDRVPAFFDVENGTDVYELVLALSKVMGDGSSKRGLGPSIPGLIRAARYVLDFPKSNWDLYQKSPSSIAEFHENLSKFRRNSTVDLVRREFGRIRNYNSEKKSMGVRVFKREKSCTLSQAATYTRVFPGALLAAAEKELLKDGVGRSDAGGGQLIFRIKSLEVIKRRVAERITWKEFCDLTGLPRLALEQLLALGAFKAVSDPVIDELLQGKQLEREAIARFLSGFIGLKVSSPASGWLSLSQVMTGFGGRDKPWGKVLLAGLAGALPGGFRRGPHSALKLSALLIHPVTARELVMGSAGRGGRFSFSSLAYGEFRREQLTLSEVRSHLNCTVQDVRQMRDVGLINLVSERGQPELYARSDVEAIGSTYISTMEIAARIGVKAGKIWERIGLAEGRALFGQGLHSRADIEPTINECISYSEDFEDSYLRDWSSEERTSSWSVHRASLALPKAERNR